MYLINLLRQQAPDWFDSGWHATLADACRKAYDAECGILDWILEPGELDFVTRSQLRAFIAERFNRSLVAVGGERIFDVDQAELEPLAWFDEEIYAPTHVDFFHKKSVAYAKRGQSITAGDLF